MSATDEFLNNNEAYAAEFSKGDLPMPPAKKTAVVGLHGRPAPRSRSPGSRGG